MKSSEQDRLTNTGKIGRCSPGAKRKMLFPNRVDKEKEISSVGKVVALQSYTGNRVTRQIFEYRRQILNDYVCHG